MQPPKTCNLWYYLYLWYRKMLKTGHPLFEPLQWFGTRGIRLKRTQTSMFALPQNTTLCMLSCALSPPSLNLLRKTCSCNILKILLLLIAFIWIPIISRNYSWDCTSLSVISWDFLGWTIPRISFGQMVGKRKYFYFIPQMGNYT